MSKNGKFDLVISGGGLVGGSLACALAPSNLKIALIEATRFDSLDQPSFDARLIALTYSAKNIFGALNVWQKMEPDEATAINRIEVSDCSRRGCARLNAEDVEREALGWNVQARALGRHIFQRLQETENVSIFSPARTTELVIHDDRVDISVESIEDRNVRKLTGNLLAVADGGRSNLRELLNFKVRRKPYSQQALVCQVKANKPNRGTAYEHFTKSGPLALLPVSERSYALVWTLEVQEAERLQAASDELFLTALQNEFGERAGSFVALAGDRNTYPLKLSELDSAIRERVVVVGNAAHTVHPVAGQGFNLGLRDVAALAEVLETHSRRGWDIGCYDVLVNYERWRKREGRAVARFTDGLIRTFANDYPLLSLVRNFGLDVVQATPLFRRFLLTRTMGLHGRQSRLVTR